LFSNCSRLVNVSLAHNFLTTLPAGFFNNNALVEQLDLRNNNLSSLPDDVFSGLASLRDLNLGGNALLHVNDALLSKLERLERLVLRGNRLRSMSPGSLAGSPGLRLVDVSDNALTFPASTLHRATPFSACVKLEMLNLEKNQVTELYPEWSIPLTRLTKLNLRFNNLTKVAYDDLAFTSNGLTLDLRDNFISEVYFYSPGVLALLDGDEKGNTGELFGRWI
jgi:Leucine-rich repeat (LRR) protein